MPGEQRQQFRCDLLCLSCQHTFVVGVMLAAARAALFPMAAMAVLKFPFAVHYRMARCRAAQPEHRPHERW